MNQETSPLLTSRDDTVAVLTLNRPERLNAFSEEMQSALISTLAEIEEDTDVRAVVLTGAGRGFCAGGDVKSMAESRLGEGPSQLRPISRTWGALPLALRNCTKPIIAAVNGAAAGAGLDIALACDIRIASSDARFAASFARVGLVPDNGGMYLLPRAVGVQRACEMIFSARIVDANEALEYGLVLEVVPGDQLLSRATELAQTFAANAPLAVRLAKRGIYKGQDLPFESSFDHVNFSQVYLQQTADHKEGIRAFVERRTPNFSGQPQRSAE